MAKDMSHAQFIQALARHGLTSEGFMGYVRYVPPAGSKVNACCFSYENSASSTWRGRLAYCLAELEKLKALYEETSVS